MENIKKLIEKYNLIKKGETIGVGVSGGKDSMALLNYLNEIKFDYGFDVIAITIDHSIREASKGEVKFVEDFCNKNSIRVCRFKIDSITLSKQKGISLESGAREGRFLVFEKLLNEHIVDKIALAHHKFDQAETILMHLFRGSGVTGLKGMSVIRDNKYIRPMLETSREQIEKYIQENEIPFVQDESNFENEYNRNFIRNEVLPLIQKRWPNAINSITNFGLLASQDDEYIQSQVPKDSLIIGEKEVKVPLSYFVYPKPITSRLLYKALHSIGINKDIENKHIDMILDFVQSGQNGKRLELPLKVSVYKEYDYLTILSKQKEVPHLYEKHKLGTFAVDGFGRITTKKVDALDNDPNALFYDPDKLPKDAAWRFRQNGDVFSKFGGGTKKLKDYLIDIKYPQRMRSVLPVLASDNEVYIIANVAISSKIKVDENSKRIYKVTTNWLLT